MTNLFQSLRDDFAARGINQELHKLNELEETIDGKAEEQEFMKPDLICLWGQNVILQSHVEDLDNTSKKE